MMLALDIQHLNKTYASGVTALHDINLQVRPGEFVGLLGPNGAGKTTIVGILNTLVVKSSGSVRVFDYNLDTQPALLKSCIGTVPQEYNCSNNDSVLNIVCTQAGYFGLAPKAARERAQYYLERMALWHKRHMTAKSLSGGMKRRLMIARALVHQPKILLLDEPTAGVDIQVRHTMWQFLNELKQAGTTIILTTHYLEEAEAHCDRIAIINHGKIIREGKTHMLLKELKSKSFILECEAKIPETSLPPGVTVVALDACRYRLCLPENQSLNSLLQMLLDANIAVLSILPEKNRLEELFIHLTQPVEVG